MKLQRADARADTLTLEKAAGMTINTGRKRRTTRGPPGILPTNSLRSTTCNPRQANENKPLIFYAIGLELEIELVRVLRLSGRRIALLELFEDLALA